MESQLRKIIITSALPYANGPIHLGHMVEYIQSDIWARFQKLKGHEVFYVCAEDTHGTPIMLKARNENIEPEELIARIAKEHIRDFTDFNIEFDNYYTTHSEENRSFSNEIYARLKEQNYIYEKVITQAYDPIEKMFLPDRFIQGICPSCKAEGQNGDNCERCGATYSPIELISAVSVISGSTPEYRDTNHYFFRLSKCESMLKSWTTSGSLQKGVINKLSEWFESGLQDWDISRDAPYFGFEIPDADDKYFYVWLDAPIGYMASFKNLCDQKDMDFNAFWDSGSESELYHFVGKDILYFHTLFWPAILHASGYRTPSAVYTHGFLTINGQKMSKSRGTFITARQYLDHLDPDCLRYYFAAKLNNRIEDLDFNVNDFIDRVNADLIGKLINIASRCAGFIEKRFNGYLGDKLPEYDLYNNLVSASDKIFQCYDNREFSKALRNIMNHADMVNQYINREKPWVIAKETGRDRDLQDICTLGLNLFRILMIWLSPVTPALAKRSSDFLRHPLQTNDSMKSIDQPLLNHKISKFKPLLQRIDINDAKKILDDPSISEKEKTMTSNSENVSSPNKISIDDFNKIDLRVAKIIKAEEVENSDKLLHIELDVGNEQRTVFAGIKNAYNPADLVGQLVVIVANLEPRKMRFGVSDGMILAASNEDQVGIFLIKPSEGSTPGMKVK